MSFIEVERRLRKIGAREIDNSTQMGTFAVVDTAKFVTKGIANRDNARWKRAQYVVVDYCPSTNVQICLKGFLQFAERCQILIIANTNQVFNGDGRSIEMSDL